jgi:uncharacterized protein YbcV (DUF1398 family)
MTSSGLLGPFLRLVLKFVIDNVIKGTSRILMNLYLYWSRSNTRQSSFKHFFENSWVGDVFQFCVRIKGETC